MKFLHIAKKAEHTAARSVALLLIVLGAFPFHGAGDREERGTNGQDHPAVEWTGFEKVRDGEYTGEYGGFFSLTRVRVVVKDGTLLKIEILAHRHGPGYGAERLTEDIRGKQSLDVDAVSGATKSSRVLVKAVETALKRGL